MDRAEAPGAGAPASRPQCSVVLVVEDEADIREVVAFALELHGYAFELAANGREALDKLSTMPRPCLVLLDIMMPVMSGIEFLRILREDHVFATLPVVVVSAFDQVASGVEGASGFLKKPVELEEILTTVRRYCAEPEPTFPRPSAAAR